MSVYKGNKLVAGGSIDTHFVRKPAWSQVIELSPEQLHAGYTAPSDGMFICSAVMPTLGGGGDSISRVITINGIPIASGQYISNDVFSFDSNSCPVNKGDLIKANIDNAWESERRYFVPFEDSTVSESDVEVVTPELIRNLHDPDWSQAVSITVGQLSSGYTAPGRGIIVGWVMSIMNTMSITVNDVVIGESTCKANDWTSYPSIQVPVNKNDVLKVTQDVSSKKMNLSFVPYKAQ